MRVNTGVTKSLFDIFSDVNYISIAPTYFVSDPPIAGLFTPYGGDPPIQYPVTR